MKKDVKSLKLSAKYLWRQSKKVKSLALTPLFFKRVNMSPLFFMAILLCTIICAPTLFANITFVSSTSNASTGGNAKSQNIEISLPSGVAENDVLIASIAFRPESSTIATPSGWTLLRIVPQPDSISSKLAIFYRIATASEQSSHSWEIRKSGGNSTNGIAGSISAFRGVDITTPIDVEGGQPTPNATSHATPSVATTTANTMLVSTHEYASSGTWIPPDGMTEAIDIRSASGASGIALSVNYQLQEAMGPTGNKIATASGYSDRGATHILALRPIQSTTPIADYRFDDCSWNELGDVKDSSGNALHGSVVNSTVLINEEGQINNGADFNPTGFTGHIEVADNDLLDGTDKLTIMGWINPATLDPINGNVLGIISKRNGSSSEYAYGVFMGYNTSGCSTDRLCIDIDGTNKRFSSNGSFPVGEWKHFAIVYNKGVAWVYINGELDKEESGLSASIKNSTAPLRIGSLYDNASQPKPFKGKMDELKIFRNALSPSQIQQIYANEFAKNNYYDGSPRAEMACGTCSEFDDGYHIISPFGTGEKRFEAYCKDNKNYLMLPFYNSRAQNSNFLFITNPISNNYYNAGNSKKPIKMLEVDFDIPNEQLVVKKIIYEDDSEGFDFSNLNLIGTPFAFVNPRDTATITNCSADNISRVRIGLNQAVKINPRATGYSRQCTINDPKLQFLSDYKFLEFGGVEHLYEDCAQLATNTTASQLPEVTGSFYMDPKKLGRAHSDRDRAFVASCKYQPDLNQAWTFLLTLDGYTTTTKNDVTSQQDTCTKLGLTFYTPNSKTTFSRVQQFLLDSQPSQWGNYVGTVREYFTDNGISGWATDSQESELKSDPIPDGLMWPYGPMGIYRPSDGAGGSNDKKMPKSAQYLTQTEKNAGFGSMEETGWRSLYYDYYGDLDRDLWWVADIAAGYRADLTAQNPKPVEPNGDYDANNWLGWFTDANGNVVHYNDQDGNDRYRYSNYMCMSFSNIDEIVRYQPVFGAFDIIESSVPSGAEITNRFIQTKIVSAPTDLDMIVLREDENSLEPNKEISVGLFLNEIEVSGGAEIPRDVLYIGDIKKDNTGSLDNHKPTGRIDLPTFSRQSAHPKLFFKFKYCNRSDYEWTDCWDVSGNIATCKASELAVCESVDSDYFAMRPKEFNILPPTNIYAGEDFTLTLQALDDNSAPTANYNELKDSSFEISGKIGKSGCSEGSMLIDVFRFDEGEKGVVASYSENGDLNVTIQEISGSEFANIDSGDTLLADRLVTPVIKTIGIKPYELNITSADFAASTGDDWLYMADVSDMNVTASATVQANNKQHQALQNFDALCYASDVNLSFKYSVAKPNSVVNLSYIPNTLDINKSIDDINKTITISASDFSQGLSSTQYSFNINRSQDAPLRPVDISLEGVEVASTDVAKDENNATVEINRTFLYGRLRVYDVETSMGPEVEVPLFIEVYDPSGSFGGAGQQNSLYWYTNKWHINNSFGELKDINSTEINKGFSDIKNDVTEESISLSEGIVNLALKHNFAEATKRTIHLNISPWLWHLPGDNANAYDYNSSSTCKEHPCFEFYYYPYSATGVGNAIHSGDSDGFGGSDFNLSDAEQTRQGVKVFR